MIITDLFESPQSCPECGGPAFSDLILAEKKDACYYKVKASAKVWPSAYASGRLVQCRKKGAANYGKSKNEGMAEGKVSGYKMYPNHDGTWYVEDENENVVLRNASEGEAQQAVWSGNQKLKQGVAGDAALAEEFDLIESIIDRLAEHNGVAAEAIWEDLESLTDDELYVFAVTMPLMEDWQKVNKRDKTDGMSRRAVKAYRREHPGSKLKTAVTTKPSKLKRGSKASKRRKSYCSRSRGQMKMHSISCAKTPDKAICKARRRWNCESVDFNLSEMDKTQTSPGRDGDIDWTKKQIHLGPESIIKAKDIAKHGLKAIDKAMKKSHADTPKKQGVAEAGPFSYGKAPRKGSVADLAAKKRKEQERGKQPVEPRDQQVGVAKVTKGVAEAFGPLPRDKQQIRLGRHSVDIERVGLNKNYIGFAWNDSQGKEHYEEVPVGDLGSYDDLKARIKGEIQYQERRLKKGVAEGSNYEREPLYHATLKAFEPSIMKSGLLPGGNLRMFDWSDKNYVYLSNYPDIASSFVDPGVIEPDAEHEEQILELMNQGGVIFKIDQNKLNRSLLRADPHFVRDDDTGAETYIYSGVIPPSAVIGKEYFNINESKQGVAESDTGDTPIDSMTVQELAAYLNVPVTQVTQDLAAAREMARDKAKDMVGEGMADDMLKLAQKISPAARLRGTPDQERERTKQAMAQRDQDRQSREQAQIAADRERLPELEAQYQEMKQLYDQLGGSGWQYADSEQNLSSSERRARAMAPQMQQLASRIQQAKQAQNIEEGSLEAAANDPVVVILDPAGKYLDKMALSSAVQKYRLGAADTVKKQLANQNYTKIGQYTIQSPMSGQSAVAEHINRMCHLAGLGQK